MRMCAPLHSHHNNCRSVCVQSRSRARAHTCDHTGTSTWRMMRPWPRGAPCTCAVISCGARCNTHKNRLESHYTQPQIQCARVRARTRSTATGIERERETGTRSHQRRTRACLAYGPRRRAASPCRRRRRRHVTRNGHDCRSLMGVYVCVCACARAREKIKQNGGVAINWTTNRNDREVGMAERGPGGGLIQRCAWCVVYVCT